MTVELKTYDAAKLVETLSASIRPDLEAATTGSTDGVKVMRSIKTVRALTLDTVKDLKLSPARAEELIRGVLAKLAEKTRAEGTEGAAKLASIFGTAQTQVNDAATIRTEFRKARNNFNPYPFEGTKAPLPENFARQMAAILNWAGALGAGASHDYSHMNQIGNTAAGEKDLRPGDEGNVDGVHQRQDFLPYKLIVEKDGNVNDPQMLRVVGKSAIGVQNALRGLALGLAGGIPEGNTSEEFTTNVRAMLDPTSNARANYKFDPSFAAHIERVGHELKGLLEYVERVDNPEKVLVGGTDLKAKFPLAYAALAGVQAFWVRDQLDAETAYKRPLPFAQLPLATAISNAAPVLAALDAAREASRLLSDFFHKGLDSMAPVGDGIRPGDDMYKVQLVLSTSSALAVGALKPGVRNERHAIGVASECAFQIVNRYLDGEKPDVRMERMTDVEAVLKRACLQAGEEFYKPNGKKADGAWGANLDHLPDLMVALEGGGSADRFRARLAELIQPNRVSLEDIGDVLVEQFGMPPLSMDDLRGFLAERNKADDYFVGNLIPGPDKDGRPKQIFPTRAELDALGVPRLNAEDRKILAVSWATCNATWKQGQAFRAPDDATRRDEVARSQVYRPYSTLVGGQDTAKGIYDVAKDHWGLAKAAAARADYKIR